MFKKLLKKILLTVLVLALLVGVVLGVRWLNASRSTDISLYAQDENPILNESLTALEGEGLQLVEENDRLQLYVNFDDGNIEVVNKANGYVWRSCPTEEDMALEKSNKLWTNNLKAPIMFTYVQEKDAANSKYSNTLTENAVVTVYHSGGFGFLDDLKVGDGVLDAGLDAVQIDGLKAVATVRLDAALVALEQDVCTDDSILARNAVADEGVDNEVGDCFPINDTGLCHCLIPSVLIFILELVPKAPCRFIVT